MTSVNKKASINLEFEKSVVKYLRDNPDFFEREVNLLASMRLPHESGTAVSLIERQLAVLRQQKDDIKKQLHILIQNSKANEGLSESINSFILAILATTNLSELIDIISVKLKNDFNANAVVLRLFQTQFSNSEQQELIHTRQEFVDWSEPVLGAFEKVIKGRKPVCGNLKKGQLDSLFVENADTVASAALIPLIDNSDSTVCYGMLAIGSKDRNHFHAEMGTVFLSNMGKIISVLLNKYR